MRDVESGGKGTVKIAILIPRKLNSLFAKSAANLSICKTDPCVSDAEDLRYISQLCVPGAFLKTR